jgi:hypothetical protein
LRSEWRRWQTKPSAPWRPRIANYAREELAGVDVISVGPLFAEPEPGGVQCSVIVIVPERNTARKSGRASARAKRWPRWCAIAGSTKGVL